VWAVNQVARHVPALVLRLVEATARLQAGGAGSYAEALAAHRDVLKELRAKAEEILEASAMRPTLDVLTRVVHDLRAGVLNPESRPSIEAGRLARDVADEGAANPFEQELPFSVPAAAPKAAPAPDAERARREEARAIEEARVARLRRLKQLREAVAAAEATHARDERAVEAARRALADAETKLAASGEALAASGAALEAAEKESG
jgi:type IV secretory pathway VirB10-like protein